MNIVFMLSILQSSFLELTLWWIKSIAALVLAVILVIGGLCLVYFLCVLVSVIAGALHQNYTDAKLRKSSRKIYKIY